MSEGDIKADIMMAATDAGHRLMNNAVGRAKYPGKNGKPTYVPYGVGGTDAPDLVGWSRDGYAILIEVKKPGEVPREGQDKWRVAARRSCPTLRIGWADNVADAMLICEGLLSN